MKHLDIIVEGKVQGVFFRAATKAVADQLGVKGFVKNLANGTVYIEAESELITQGEIRTGYIRYNTLEDKLFKNLTKNLKTSRV